MKLLHVIDGMDPKLGGVSQAVRTMIRGLRQMDIFNEVVCLENPDAQYLADVNPPVHSLGRGKGPWHYNHRLLPWLLKNLSSYDAVIVHGLWLYPSYAVRKAASILRSLHNKSQFDTKQKATKIFIMPHGMLDPYFQRAASRKLKAFRNWLYWKLIENRVINEANGELFTCEEERRLAREPFRPYHPKQEIVVGLGVGEPPCFEQSMREKFLKKCPELNGYAYLLFLGRIHPKKGVDLLVKAYAEIVAAFRGGKKQYAEFAVTVNENNSLPKLVIAGPGIETAYGQKIVRFINNVPGLTELILFPGMLSGDAKWGAFYGCDAFALPSHQENFGIAVVEALACSKPVLISYPVNIWKEIINSGAGIIAYPTHQGVLNLLQQWFELEKSTKHQMGERARMCYDTTFALKPATGRLLQALSGE